MSALNVEVVSLRSLTSTGFSYHNYTREKVLKFPGYISPKFSKFILSSKWFIIFSKHVRHPRTSPYSFLHIAIPYSDPQFLKVVPNRSHTRKSHDSSQNSIYTVTCNKLIPRTQLFSRLSPLYIPIHCSDSQFSVTRGGPTGPVIPRWCAP